MSDDHQQNSNAKLNHFPKSVNSKCSGCEELSKQFQLYKDATEKRHNTLMDILAEHKVLLNRIATQTAVATNLDDFFPINTEEKLKEFDDILVTHSDQYIRKIKSLLDGNAERNIHVVFGKDIIMNFNLDGSFGKRRLRDFPNVLKAIIDAISTFSELAEKTLRAAFQRQKKKYFKQLGRIKAKQQIDDIYSNIEDYSLYEPIIIYNT